MRTTVKFMVSIASHLQHQQSLGLIACFGTDMFHFCFVIVAQVIKSPTVLLRVDSLFQLVLNKPILRGVQYAFKHAVLHTLSIVYTFFGDFSKALSASRVLGIYVVCYEH